MSEHKDFWRNLPTGAYVGIGRFGEDDADLGYAFDPQTDRAEAVSLYAEALGSDEPTLVLWVRPQGDTLAISDVTAEFHAEANAYLAARGDDPLPNLGDPRLPAAFLTHVARWADGDLGSMGDVVAANDEARILASAQEFMTCYGDRPENAGLAGVILLVEKSEAGWSVREIAAAPGDAPRVTAGLSQ